MKPHCLALVAVAAALLSACGSDSQDEGVGGVTAGEARALNEAAEMLDSRAAPVNQASPSKQTD